MQTNHGNQHAAGGHGHERTERLVTVLVAVIVLQSGGICKVLLEVYRDYFLQWDWHQPPTCERQQISCVDFFLFLFF